MKRRYNSALALVVAFALGWLMGWLVANPGILGGK